MFNLKCVFSRQYLGRSCFIYSDSLCLLIELFNLFIFDVIIDIVGFASAFIFCFIYYSIHFFTVFFYIR